MSYCLAYIKVMIYGQTHNFKRYFDETWNVFEGKNLRCNWMG